MQATDSNTDANADSNTVYSSISSNDDDEKEEDAYRREVVFKILYITKFLANGV